jgi:hypothetical protein
VAQTYNFSTQEADARGLQVQGQPGLPWERDRKKRRETGWRGEVRRGGEKREKKRDKACRRACLFPKQGWVGGRLTEHSGPESG